MLIFLSLRIYDKMIYFIVTFITEWLDAKIKTVANSPVTPLIMIHNGRKLLCTLTSKEVTQNVCMSALVLSQRTVQYLLHQHTNV